MQTEDPRQKTSWLRHVGFAVALAVLISAAICGLWQLGDRRSADERLADIEATRNIPDIQDAAILYRELFQDSCATSLSDSRPESLSGSVFNQRLYEPWRSEEAPELARFIKQHRYIIDKLLEASALDECRFPLTTDITAVLSEVNHASMRQWAFLLGFAANNDVAEGRLDDATAKWRCILQMGHHLRQRPVLLDFVVADGIQTIGLKRLVRFVAGEESTETDLKKIEAMPLLTADAWTENLRDIRMADDLPVQKMMVQWSPTERLKFRFFAYRFNKATGGLLNKSTSEDKAAQSYFRTMALARGLRIIIALKRHRTEIGHWPESLDEIAASLPEPILTDPLNEGPFVYRRTNGAFELYSTGANKIDEQGRGESEGGDDWPIWTPPAPAPPSSQGNNAIMNELKPIYGERYIARPQADANAP
jgi:hypothetical protein